MPEKSNPVDPRIEYVWRFWFADSLESAEALQRRVDFWFGSEDGETTAVDRQIDREFRADMERAAAGHLADWPRTPRGRLALILLMDQFPRNAFRGTARAFATDREALGLALEGMRQGADALLQPAERLFFYLPLEHAEDIEVQERAVAACAALALDVTGADPRLLRGMHPLRRAAPRHHSPLRTFSTSQCHPRPAEHG